MSDTLHEALITFHCCRRQLNHNESAFLEWNGIRLVGQPRRCKRYSNASQCYIVRKLPMLFVTTYAFKPYYESFLCVYLGLTHF